MDHYELPIWSDLYDEKSQLLQENQLLYAVIQVEKKEGETRLSCKWVDDLSRADDSMVEACDLAYDKAKHQSARFAHMKAAAPKGTTSVKKEEVDTKMKVSAKVPGPIKLNLDANAIRLSHILKLKQLFEKHRGSTPLQLDFTVNEKVIAAVHIDQTWGVMATPEFEKELESIPGLYRT